MGGSGSGGTRLRYPRPDRFVTDVFDPDGVYQGTLPEGAPWPATFTADGRVVALETDELGIQSFVVYSVGRTGA